MFRVTDYNLTPLKSNLLGKQKIKEMKKIIITSLLGLFTIVGYSQLASDALRYSTTTHNGDARFMSMGGAFGALGGNISSFNYNPAGIGVYRRSDASITASFFNNENTARYNSELNKYSQNDFSISSGGFVLASNNFNMPSNGDFSNFKFGFSYNVLKNFDNITYISGANTSNSIGDMFAALAHGLSIADIEDNNPNSINAFDLNPAWYAFLFDEGNSPGEYVGGSPPGGVQQSKMIESWGSLNEIALTFGGNYGDKLYLGATIGLPILDYHEIKIYSEESLDNNIPDDKYASALITDYLDTKAYGINLKLGMIYKANDMLRFGAALHTPTYYYDMNDEWMTSMESDFNTGPIDSPTGYYEYHLSTPMKAIGSVAVVFSKFGLISLDYEYLDYSSAQFSVSDYDFNAENGDIKTLYQSTNNIRLGTEWKYMNFAFRGGYSFYGSPYKNENINGEKSSYSLGIGYREGNFYFDVAWVYSETDNENSFYNYGGVASNLYTVNNKNTNLLFTLGTRF